MPRPSRLVMNSSGTGVFHHVGDQSPERNLGNILGRDVYDALVSRGGHNFITRPVWSRNKSKLNYLSNDQGY
jgi:hypothetical protein